MRAKYILLKGLEGSDWDELVLVKEGSLKEIKKEFNKRKRPYILWFLIDKDQLPKDFNGKNRFKELFLVAQEGAGKDIVEIDYQCPPFVGFHDIIATNRSWGILKSLAVPQSS